MIKEQRKHCGINDITDVQAFNLLDNIEFKSSINEITDIEAFNLLHNIESKSQAKNPNQRVGCILFGGKDSQVKTVVTTNTYPNNTGVHAEINAISMYLKSLPDYSSTNPFLNMLVTYSPCLECAKVIEYIPEIKHIKYSFSHDENAIKMLEQGSILIRKLDTPYEKKNLKLHTYSSEWIPEVKNIIITREVDGHIILQYTDDMAFDIRPQAILAMRKRNSVSEVYDVICVYMRHICAYKFIYIYTYMNI
jgi:tRNA(Arg) A34 adenosine deaminase TadA